MHAIIIRTAGGPEALEDADLPLPDPGPGQVRIRVAAAAVNPVDRAVRSGALAEAGLMPAFGTRPWFGVGMDVAGTIDAVGPGVHRLAAGDAVVGLQDRLDIPLGAYAEALVLDATAVTHAPRSASPSRRRRYRSTP